MDGGVATPGPPGFGPCGERAGGEGSSFAGDPPQHEVGGGEGIRLPEPAQGDVLGRPVADARQRGERGADLVRRPVEDEPPVGHGPGQGADRPRARRDEPEARQVRGGERRGRGEEVGEAVHRPGQPRAGPLDEPRRERATGGEAHLLPQHRAHGALERVPRPGDPQPGPPAHERREQRVAPEGGADGGRVRREVEHPADPGGQREERGRGSPRDAQVDLVPPAHGAHGHRGGAGGKRDRPHVAARVHPLDARDRPRAEKREGVVKAPGRAEREAQRDLAAGGRRVRLPEPAQGARRAVVGPQERVVEAAEAREARRERDLRHGEVGLVDQPLREVEPAGLGHGEGGAPTWATKRRWSWRGPIPSRAASASTESASSAPSWTSASARRTTAEVPSQAGVPGAASGRQRRQGRKPASAAAAAVGK